MERRVLVTGAGTGASNSLIRSLRAGDPFLFVAGCHHDRFFLKKSSADRSYLVPRLDDPMLADGLRRVVEAERIDLLVPTSDAAVRAVSALRDRLPCRTFLPQPAVVDLCQDKYALTAFLQARGVPVPATSALAGLDELEDVFRRLGSPSRLWCRLRTGTGSMGATPVTSPEQARTWIRSWEAESRTPAASFTLSEYLSGRDFGCQSLWSEGELVLIKTYERLSYLLTGGSRVSSVAALAKTVHEPRVVEICAQAVRALDGRASGVFSIDLKEDAGGVPRLTEINAGRLSAATNIVDLTGKHNMALTYVRLALGEPVDIRGEYDVAEEWYMVRDFDTLPGIFHAEELFEGIEEAWT